jgi:hypothetical protein
MSYKLGWKNSSYPVSKSDMSLEHMRINFFFFINSTIKACEKEILFVKHIIHTC